MSVDKVNMGWLIAAACCAVLACLLSFQFVHAAEIKRSVGKPGEAEFIRITGEFVKGDDEKFKKIVFNTEKAIVVFDSPGGLIFPALEIGRAIRFKGFGTMVGGDCYSACAVAWLAGEPRMMSKTASIGFHAAYTEDEAGKKTPAAVGNALIGAYLNKLGLSDRVVAFVTTAGPDEVKWLKKDKADGLGLSVVVLDLGEDDATAEQPTKKKTQLPACPESERRHNCFGTFISASGSKYVGEYKGDDFHGQGTLSYSNGDKYVGKFEFGTYHGQGTYTYASGAKYIGEWKDGKRHGQGAYTFVNGDKYTGEFKENKKHGKGIYTNADGHILEGPDNKLGVEPELPAGKWSITNNGCKVYNPSPEPNETVRWSGRCVNGFAEGYGTEQWFAAGKPSNKLIGIMVRGNFADGRSIEIYLPKDIRNSEIHLAKTYIGTFSNSRREGTGVEIFENGDRYTGDFKNNKRSGKGTAIFASGAKYVGSFKDGRLHGLGTYNFSDGDKYVGDYKDGEKNGQGTYTFASGAKYVGEFAGDKLNGRGTYTFPDGGKYVGDYKDGEKNGQGTYTYSNGDKYVGKYKNGKYDGLGAYTYANGSSYIGEFKDDKYHGYGVYIFEDGSNYAGEYKEDKYHGLGAYTDTDGSEYVGEFVDNKYHGQGTQTNANGEKYSGEFKNGEKNGLITLIFASGQKYVSYYKDDKPRGQGIFTNADGDTYSGEFKEGKFHGKGIEIYADGRATKEGIWIEGKFSYAEKIIFSQHQNDLSLNEVRENSDGGHQSSLPYCQGPDDLKWNNCFGKYTFPQGGDYIGEWRLGKFHGQGTARFASGDKYIGEFKENKKHGQGSYTFSSGSKYVGQWKANTFHGQGTLKQRVFDFDVYMLDRARAKGTNFSFYISKYIGEFKDDDKNGKGIEINSGGRPTLEGIWSDNKFIRAEKIIPLSPQTERIINEIPETPNILVPGTVFKDCGGCPEMVVIPAGSFLMGTANGGSNDERPQRQVQVKTFAIGKYEVTQKEWELVMGNNPSWNKGRTLPVVKISWDDTQVFVQMLSQTTGKNYRLPSEAEWEYAARGGSNSMYPWGDNPSELGRYAWFSENSLSTDSVVNSVGLKAPNQFGLYDMLGNVWEWTQDCWNENYNGSPTDGSSSPRGDCSLRVVRGGSAINYPSNLRSANRIRNSTAFRNYVYGFRVARDN